MKTLTLLLVACVLAASPVFADAGAWLRTMLEDIEQSHKRQPVYVRYTLHDITPVDPQRLAFLRERVGTNDQHPLYQELVQAQARHDGTAGWMCQAWHGDGLWRFNRDILHRAGDIADYGANAKEVWVLSPPNLILTTNGAPRSPERDYSVLGDESLRNLATMLSGGLSNVWDAKAVLKYESLSDGRWRAGGIKQRGNFELRWEAHGREPGAPGQAGTVESVISTGFLNGQQRGSMTYKSEDWRTWDGGRWAATTVIETDSGSGIVRRFQLLDLKDAKQADLLSITKTPGLDGKDAVRGTVLLSGLDDFRSREVAHLRADEQGTFVEVTPKQVKSNAWLRYAGWCLLAVLVIVFIIVKRRNA